MGLTQLRILKKISRKGQGTLSIIEEKQFRGDQRAEKSLNQDGGFACFKDGFIFWQPENVLQFGLFLGV